MIALRVAGGTGDANPSLFYQPLMLANTATSSAIVGATMAERDVVKSLIDFSFIIKAQLESEETALLRSLLSMAIMEAEDVLETMDEKQKSASKSNAKIAKG
jgi:hypothetical protein